MLEHRIDLEEFDAFLLDMDGVLYLGGSPLEGSIEAVKNLRRLEKKLAFLTNNSSLSRRGYERKLSGFGLSVDKSEIMTSAYATALYLSELTEDKAEEDRTVYVIGEEGLRKELEKAGFEVLSRKEAEGASFVVVGLDRNLTYEKIWGGLSAVLSSAEFVATNPDPTYPTESGLAPGAGASIGALSASAEKEPSKIIGKPSPYMIDATLEILDISPDRTAVIGDRIDIDIQAGKKADLTTILVLTGVDSKEDVDAANKTKRAPDYVIESLSQLIN